MGVGREGRVIDEVWNCLVWTVEDARWVLTGV